MRSPPRWLRVSISQFFPVAFVSLLVLASVSANDLATPGGCSDTHLFSEFPWVRGPGRPLAFPLRSHEPVSQRCAVPAVPDLRLHAGRTHPRLLCRWRRLVPSGSWDRGARVCCLSAAASFLRGPPCRRLTHGSLLPQSQRGAVCEGGRRHGLARAPSPWPCSVGRRRPRSPTLQEKGSHERRNARGRGPWGPPSSLPAMLPKPSSGFSPFSLPRFLVVWAVYIFTFLPTPRPSQQRLELTRLRVLPRDEPRSFNS